MSHLRRQLAEIELERHADRILRSVPARSGNILNADQTRRRTRRESVALDDALEPPSKPEVVADLRFIGSMSPLSDEQRYVYSLWVEGYGVREIATALGASPATASRVLRSALLRCWLMGPVPFGEFIRRAIYRRPSGSRSGYRSGRRCIVCAVPLWDDSREQTCGSDDCRATIRRRRALDRRRMGWR